MLHDRTAGPDAPASRRPPAGTVSPRLPAIDGLLALAVLVVVLIHAGVPQASRGYIGVDVCFAVSGFLITLTLLRERSRTGVVSVRDFAVRRFWRLAPGLVVMLVFAAVLEIGAGATRPGAFLVEAAKAVTGTYNIWWGIAATGWRPGMTLAHTWAIGVDVQFCVLWGLALFVGVRVLPSRRSRLIAAVVLWLCCTLARIVTVVALGPASGFWWPWSRVSELVAGCVLALALHGRPGTALARVLRTPVVAVAAGLGLLLYLKLGTREFAPATAFVGLPVVVVLTLLIVGHLYLASGAGGVSAVLGWSPLAWLGRRSYGLYLFHYPIAITLAAHHVAWQWVLVITLAGTVAAAALSFTFVEEPLGRLGASQRRPVETPRFATVGS